MPPAPPRTASASTVTQCRSMSSTTHGEQLRSPPQYHSPMGQSYNTMSHLNRSNSDGQRYAESYNGGYDSPSTIRGTPISQFGASHASNFGTTNGMQFQRPSNTSPRISRPSTQPTTGPTQFRTGPTTYASPPPSHNHEQQSPHYSGSFLPTHHPPLVTVAPPFPSMNIHQTSIDMQHQYSHNAMAVDPQEGELDNGFPVQIDSPTSAPIFDEVNGLYSNSPQAMTSDFANWLFNPGFSNGPPEALQRGFTLGPSGFSDLMKNGDSPAEPTHPTFPPQHRMAVATILEPDSSQSTLSEDKRQQLLTLMRENFLEKGSQTQKRDLLEGDDESEGHVLSLKMLQTFIGSYWYHFHPQMPILHRPTFCADKAQNLLLLSVIAIGASCVDQRYGEDVISAGADLSNFIARHLRGELFDDADFGPPGKLWVFQAFLLLEVYEKMYSTRALHERAHIHHGTTLNLMRRGSSLRGRSALDSPPSLKDERAYKSSSAGPATPGQWWNHWITNEATRRVAFAAFIIDATHATQFGHAATLNAHEMRLPLPCSEELWSATSSFEVVELERKLDHAGVKPVQFLDGLKLTLRGEPVRTNAFGRSALMAGLLSVSWHMYQRDLQIGVLPSMGGNVKWRKPLIMSFDYWANDFDASTTYDTSTNFDGRPSPGTVSPPGKLDEDNLFESKTVLHHLAHMAMNADIVRCQIYAKAQRLLGRTITPPEYNTAQKAIEAIWAPRATARDATFYALRFLTQVLAPDLCDPPQKGSEIGMDANGNYSARDDFLLNRPWVLYFAALIVWSYGYALEGPIKHPPQLVTFEQQRQDMRAFLKRVGGVRGPEDLEHIEGRNCCLGLLMVMRDNFKNCLWELMLEAVKLLNNCVGLLYEGR